MKTRADILNEATRLTTGDRNKSYGSVTDTHQRIADIWTVILGHPIRADQVALCMVGLKLARLINTPNHLDSFIDGAAYMAIAGEIALEDKQ